MSYYKKIYNKIEDIELIYMEIDCFLPFWFGRIIIKLFLTLEDYLLTKGKYDFKKNNWWKNNV